MIYADQEKHDTIMITMLKVKLRSDNIVCNISLSSGNAVY